MPGAPRRRRPRRVLTVIAAPTFGGAANQVLQLRAPLLERGWELIPVLPTEPGNAARRLAAADIPVIRQVMHRARATPDPRAHLALARHCAPEIAALRRLVREHGASVVQNHGDLNPQAGIAGHLEGAAVHWQLLDSRTPPPLRRVTMALATRLADSFSSVGQALAAGHPGALDFRERCVIIHAPVDVTAFQGSHARRDAAREELGIPRDAVCIGAIGNRNPQKGHEWLVRAAARARAQQPGIVVRVLGAPSPGHEAYERRLREEAAALGLAAHDGSFAVLDPGSRVPDLIAAFDVLCMPSVPNSEGMPTVILEAMAVGLPVVATDVGAVGELLEDGVTGRLVPPLDVPVLASALTTLAADARLRADWGAAGYARFHGTFGLDRLVDAYVRAYELAVAHRRGRRRHGALDRAR